MDTLEREVVNRNVRCDMFMGGARAACCGKRQSGAWRRRGEVEKDGKGEIKKYFFQIT